MPELSQLDFDAVPSPVGMPFALKCPAAGAISKTLQWASASTQKTNLCEVADSLWQKMCQPVTQAEAPPVPPGDGERQPTHCQRLGMCVCCEEGQTIDRIASRLLLFMKRRCPVGSAMRAALGNGDLVLRLFGGPRLRARGIDAVLAAQTLESWWHIGFHSWSPYMPTFMSVQPTSPTEDVAHNDERVYVQTNLDFKSLHEVASAFKGCPALFGRLYTLEKSARPIGALCPRVVPVVDCSVPMLTQFYPRFGMPRAAEGFAGAPPGEGVDADDEADVEPAEEVVPCLAVEPEAAPEGGVADMDGALELALHAYDVGLPGVEMDASGLVAAPGPEEEPPLPPPPAPPPAPLAAPGPIGAAARAAPEIAPGRRRGAATVAVQVPGGALKYYASNGNFVAECGNPAHGRCVLTKRARRAARLIAAPTDMRPLGMMVCWLGRGHVHVDKEGHWAPGEFDFPVEERLAARALLAETEHGPALVGEEMDPGEGVPVET